MRELYGVNTISTSVPRMCNKRPGTSICPMLRLTKYRRLSSASSEEGKLTGDIGHSLVADPHSQPNRWCYPDYACCLGSSGFVGLLHQDLLRHFADSYPGRIAFHINAISERHAPAPACKPFGSWAHRWRCRRRRHLPRSGRLRRLGVPSTPQQTQSSDLRDPAERPHDRAAITR